MDKSALKVLMCEVPQFDKLDSDEIEIMADHVEYRKMPAGATLLEEGSAGDSLYYIAGGIVEIRKESMDGTQTILSQFTKGAGIGEMGLIDENSRRSATATVIKESEFLVLSRKNFNDIIEKNPKIAIKVLKSIACSIASRLRHTSGRFADIFK
ncbi:MAG TPA: cyclic nucleotide-binding domain-containing protein [Nitrospinota bacterium]|jgi:CRP-like cAMP-binding protein|nr:cyclic nucleotide-binding domain-containing protein [Nitrospinota bacterium]